MPSADEEVTTTWWAQQLWELEQQRRRVEPLARRAARFSADWLAEEQRQARAEDARRRRLDERLTVLDRQIVACPRCRLPVLPVSLLPAVIRRSQPEVFGVRVRVHRCYGGLTQDVPAERAPDPLLSVAEAARLAGVSPSWLGQLARQGRIEAVRRPGGHRRYRLSAVTAFMTGGAAGVEAG